MNIVFQILAFVILKPIFLFTKRNQFYIYLPGGYWAFVYFLYGFLYFVLIYIQDTITRNNLQSGLIFLSEIGLVVINVVIFTMFIVLCKNYHEKIQYTLIQKQYSIQKKQFAETQIANAELRKLRHELKNYVFYMNYLLDKKDYEELHSYFRDFYQKEYPHLTEINTGDSIVDAVIHQKLSVAQQKNIQIHDFITPYNTGLINDLDLCVILSNLLENAIEACNNLPDSQITIKIRQVKKYLSIVISNTAAYDILKNNPQLQSSKKQRNIHGIGIKVIRELTEKYNGSIEFESTSTTFHAKLMLDTTVTGEKQI